MHTEGNDHGKPGRNVSGIRRRCGIARTLGTRRRTSAFGGIVTFLAGLSGFVLIFFFFCFAMGKAINYALVKHDGPQDKWHSHGMTMGATPRANKREDLTSNA